MNDWPVTQPLSTIRHNPPYAAARIMKVSPTNISLLAMGAAIHLFAEMSAFPIVAALLYYCIGWIALLLPKIGGHLERHIYTRVFSVGFFVAGVAALYRTFAGDLSVDAIHFFKLATGVTDGWSLAAMGVVTEGALAVFLWREVFNFMASLGFPRELYIGILINVLVLALVGVIAIKMARLIYGSDPYRFKRLTLLFSACGMFWIFSSSLLRDSIVLAGVSLLAYAWLYFLSKPGLGFRFLFIIGASLFAGAYFEFLRSEFVFVPMAMAMAAVAALLVGRKVDRGRMIAYLLVFIGLMVSGWLLASFGDSLLFALIRGQEGYTEEASMLNGAGSLGMALIVNQPMPVRLPLGAVYLFVFPIPFWSGFQFESAYHLFKSFNVIYFYFLIPLLVLSCRQLWKDKPSRSPGMIFLLFLVIGFVLAIAGTSLETRHFGAFFVPLFLLVLAPDLRILSQWRRYKQLLKLFLSSVVSVHIAWIVLKVFQ